MTHGNLLQGDQSNQNGQWKLRSALRSDTGLCEDRIAVTHNFRMVENAAKLLGIAPEVGSSIGIFTLFYRGSGD